MARVGRLEKKAKEVIKVGSLGTKVREKVRKLIREVVRRNE